MSREKRAILAPPRVAVTVPGSGGMLGRGLLSRIRASLSGVVMLTVFIAIGTGLMLFGLAGMAGPWKERLLASGDPRFFKAVLAFGAVYTLVSLRMLQLLLTGAAHEERTRRARRQPWDREYPWKREGMGPDYTSSPGGMLLGRVAFLGLIALFNLGLGSPSWLLKGIVILLDLFGLLVLWDSLAKLWQWLRFRRPTIDWKTFPGYVGEPVEATVRFPRAIHPRGPARATLRCLQDEEVPRPPDAHGNQAPPELKPFSVYSQTREIPLPDTPLRHLDVAFDLPRDVPGTCLAHQWPIYWQIVLEVPLAGPDFETVFLAPVYRRS